MDCILSLTLELGELVGVISSGFLFSMSSMSSLEMLSMLPFRPRFRAAFLDLAWGVPGSLGCLTRPFRLLRIEFRRHSKPDGPRSLSSLFDSVDEVVREEEEEVEQEGLAAFSLK